MNTVKVKREELLAKVRSNRDAHQTLFLKAQEGYRKLVIEELDRMLEDARSCAVRKVSHTGVSTTAGATALARMLWAANSMARLRVSVCIPALPAE